jgi:DNA-binding transcriptional MerR regulator
MVSAQKSPRPAPGKEKSQAQHPYRMKDLCAQTGLQRQAVHFYIQQGLLPEGEKTGRNMAYYNQAHVERLRLIRRLQEEHFLPLKAIRAVLDAYEDDAAWSPGQRQFIEAVKQRLAASLGPGPTDRTPLPVAPLLARLGLSRQDFDEMCDTGLIAVAQESGVEVTRQGDVWLLELYAELRRLGFSRELGFVPRDLGQVDGVVSTLFRKEKALITQRLSHLDAQAVATLVEQALPYMNTLLVRLHEAKLRNFIADL